MSARMRVSELFKAPPVWAADFGGREHLFAFGIRLDAAQFHKASAVQVVVGAAGALANATTVPVDTLSGPIPSGTLLDFGGKKFARLSAAAAAGASSISVDALATALVDNDAAWYEGSASQIKAVPSGTLIGRTAAEAASNSPFGPAASTDDEIYLLAFEVPDVDNDPDATAYRHGGQVKENYLPNWTNAAVWTTALKAALRSRYQCFTGVG